MSLFESGKMWLTFILGISVLIPSNRTAGAMIDQSMLDPLFGMMYDPREVHFESAPARITQLCPSFRSRKLWVYAHFKDADTEFFVVSGLVNDYGEGPVKRTVKPIPDYGSAIALRGNECRSDPLDWFWSGETNPGNLKPIKVSAAELDGMAADAIKRYIRAFGGPENSRAAIQSRKDSLDLYKVVTRHLRQFMKNPSAFSEASPEVETSPVPEPARTPSLSENSNVFLVKGTVLTLTKEQGKRRDTCIYVSVRSADGRFLTASAARKDCTSSDESRYAPGSTHSFDLKVENGITKKDANGYKVKVEQETFSGERPDSWTFDITVTLYFSDGSKSTISQENVSIQGGPPLEFSGPKP